MVLAPLCGNGYWADGDTAGLIRYSFGQNYRSLIPWRLA